MPFSARENDTDVSEFVKNNNIKMVLDVGAGSGTYGNLLKPYVDEIHAIEIWQPYVDEYNLRSIYNSVQIDDVRNLPDYTMSGRVWDLIIFGDILEHMTKEEALQVWAHASYTAKYGMISVPIIHYPQGAEFNNPYEVHVQEHIHVEDLRRDYGPFAFDKEYKVTGTFIRKFI
jgi:predicted TPR repeat methyltransferase